MFRSLSRPSSGQHLIVKGTISAHYTLRDPTCLQDVRKNNYKYYFRLKYCRTGCGISKTLCGCIRRCFRYIQVVSTAKTRSHTNIPVQGTIVLDKIYARS